MALYLTVNMNGVSAVKTSEQILVDLVSDKAARPQLVLFFRTAVPGDVYVYKNADWGTSHFIRLGREFKEKV